MDQHGGLEIGRSSSSAVMIPRSMRPSLSAVSMSASCALITSTWVAWWAVRNAVIAGTTTAAVPAVTVRRRTVRLVLRRTPAALRTPSTASSAAPITGSSARPSSETWAYNDWQIATFLERDDRLRGSVHVNAWDVEGAEIECYAEDPRFVQVMIYVRDRPFGDPRYHPIYATAEPHDLVVGFHHSKNSPAAHGFYRYFAEWHSLVPQVLMSQAVSLIFNGVFDRFPSLRVLMIESGFSYVPHLMWHADQQYRQLCHEVPWVKRKPSEAIRDQIRFASQPIEDFTAPELETLIGQMRSDELICFSSDYPHWDFDSPLTALPAGLDKRIKEKILLENAQWLYGRRT
jgi:predicted TIM-barrel fold metal-dependent hydrolase